MGFQQAIVRWWFVPLCLATIVCGKTIFDRAGESRKRDDQLIRRETTDGDELERMQRLPGHAHAGAPLLRSDAEKCRKLPSYPMYNRGKYSLGENGAYYSLGLGLNVANVFGERAALRPLYWQLEKGHTVNLMVLGGSMTVGHRCQQISNSPREKIMDLECAWPARFRQWLSTAFPNATINVLNQAKGGATSLSVLAGLGLLARTIKNVDMIFVDMLVNDAYALRTTSLDPAWRLNVNQTMSAGYEKLIHGVHALWPNAQVFCLLSGCPECLKKVEHEQKIVDHYQLPGLNFSALVQANPTLWPSDGGEENLHPSFLTHQAVADALAVAFADVWSNSCDSDEKKMPWPKRFFWNEDVLNKFQFCERPLSYYSAIEALSDKQSPRPKAVKGNWTLFEDRVGKPGWIATEGGAKLQFSLKFGKLPLLCLTWLKSYEHMGRARMSINKGEFILEGLWPKSEDDRDRLFSLSHTAWFYGEVGGDSRYNEAASTGFGIKPYSVQDIMLESMPPVHVASGTFKFKLIEVSSC